MNIPSRVATLTVMRGEADRLPGLFEDLAWADEKHIVETDPQRLPDAIYGGATVHHRPLPYGASFDAVRGEAIPHVKAEWVLVVDTDERIPPALLAHLDAHLDAWERDGIEGAWLPRQNHVLGKPLLHSSAWPDYQLRFFRRDLAVFSTRIHAGMPELKKVERLPARRELAIQHFNFETTTDFLTKLNLYSKIEADQASASQPASVARATYRASREFLARYVKMKGFKDGAHGFHYALMLGLYRYLIEVKRWERKDR